MGNDNSMLIILGLGGCFCMAIIILAIVIYFYTKKASPSAAASPTVTSGTSTRPSTGASTGASTGSSPKPVPTIFNKSNIMIKRSSDNTNLRVIYPSTATSSNADVLVRFDTGVSSGDYDACFGIEPTGNVDSSGNQTFYIINAGWCLGACVNNGSYNWTNWSTDPHARIYVGSDGALHCKTTTTTPANSTFTYDIASSSLKCGTFSMAVTFSASTLSTTDTSMLFSPTV